MLSTRREMLRLGLGSSALLACGATVPSFLTRSAKAVGPTAAKGRVLVVVQLDGGNDGLNTVVPFRDDEYARRRPKLKLAEKDLLKVDDHLGLHPALRGFAKLLEQGALAVVQGVGYPNPNRSHFESMAIWQTARVGPLSDTPGWLARWLDGRAPEGADASAFHVGEAELPQAIVGSSRHVASLAGLDQFRRRIGIGDAGAAGRQRAVLDQVVGQPRGAEGSLLQFVQRRTVSAYASSDRLESILRGPSSASGYPESYGLAQRLKVIAQLIKAGLTTPLYYAQLGGFDTHANQLNTHYRLLFELGDSLRAFLDDLKSSGDGDRVLVLVFSEFGRRLAENASGGTDHGTAAPVFLLGPAIQPGPHGPSPDLKHLDDGDPIHATDFRRVYATLLEHWLDTPSRAVLGEEFEPLPIVAAGGKPKGIG